MRASFDQTARDFREHRWRKAGSLLFLWLFFFGVVAAGETINYTGHYEMSDADSSFSLDITQTGSRADVSFSAGMKDGSGAAPDGGGTGTVDKAGELKFAFKDSFGNEGTATLVAGKDGYHLLMEMTTVTDSRSLRFYGDVLLKKTAEKPAP